MLRRFRIVLLALTLSAVGLAPAHSREGERAETPSGESALAEPSPEVEAWHEAVRKGCDWLARAENQHRDGSWGEGRKATVAVTSLCVLALMGNGNTMTTGRHSPQVRSGVNFLLRHVTSAETATDSAPEGYITVKGDEESRMHGHGYATLALALAYGMDTRTGIEREARRKAFRKRLEQAVRCIEDAQDDSGGWYYFPYPDRHEGSVTVCQVQALRAARNAGIRVKPTVIEKAVVYLERSQTPSGGFCYSVTDRERHSYALTAAALTTLFGLGEYGRKRMVLKGLEYMERSFERNYRGRASWFFYGNLYAAQTLHQAAATEWGRPYWEQWWPKMRDFLVAEQKRTFGGRGDWPHPRDRSGRTWGFGGEDYGPAYRTAIALLILEVPLEILPIFQR